MNALGIAMLAVFLLHSSVHLRERQPWELLWSCNVAALLLSVGFFARSPRLNAVATLWLITGLPFWSIYLAGGGAFMPTSLLTHLGGLTAGLRGVLAFGMPRGSWLQAVLALLALIGICHLATPRAANVNLAFAVWQGWESRFPSYALYFTFLMAVHAAAYFGAERLLAAKND